MTEFVGFAVVLDRNGERDVQLVSHRAEMQISMMCERNGNKTHLARLHRRLQAPYKHGELKRRIENFELEIFPDIDV